MPHWHWHWGVVKPAFAKRSRAWVCQLWKQLDCDHPCCLMWLQEERNMSEAPVFPGQRRRVGTIDNQLNWKDHITWDPSICSNMQEILYPSVMVRTFFSSVVCEGGSITEETTESITTTSTLPLNHHHNEQINTPSWVSQEWCYHSALVRLQQPHYVLIQGIGSVVFEFIWSTIKLIMALTQ